MLKEVIKELSNKTLSNEDTYKFWHSGRDFDKILLSWGINDIANFWNLFDTRDYNERLKMINEGTCLLFPESLDLIKKLSKVSHIKLGIISNTPPQIAEMELEKLGLSIRYFDVTHFLGTQQQKIAKPNPISIEISMNELQTKKNNTYIIGDTGLDILAGKNAGIKTIFVSRDHNKKYILKENPDYIIENLNEICDILKKIDAEGGI